MTIRVIEPNGSGHRLYYVRVLAEGCPEPMTWVTSLEAAASSQAKVHLGHLVDSGRLAVRVLEPWPSRVALLAQRRPANEVTVVLDGDRWLGAAALAGVRSRTSCRLLVMRPEQANSVAHGAAQRARRQLKRALLQIIQRLPGVLAFGLVDAFGRGADLRDGVVPVADPVLPRSVPEVRRAPGLVVGLLGAVDVRKNPALLAAACRAIPQARLVVVGGVSPDALTQLESAGLGSRLSVDNRYVDEDELVAAAAACDVIAVLYDNHDSSSGVLALAAQVGVPALVPAGSRLAASAGEFGVETSRHVDDVIASLRLVETRGDELRTAARSAGALVGTRDFVTKLTGRTR